MLTTDKINLLRNKLIPTSEELILLALFDNRAIINFETDKVLVDKLGFTPARMKTLVRTNPYIEVQRSKLVLHPKGKPCKFHYKEPYTAPDIHSFVFSRICEDIGISYGEIINEVRRFADMKNIDCSGFTTTIWYTYKREVRRYLLASGKIDIDGNVIEGSQKGETIKRGYTFAQVNTGNTVDNSMKDFVPVPEYTEAELQEMLDGLDFDED